MTESARESRVVAKVKAFSERNHFETFEGLVDSEIDHLRLSHGNVLRLETDADRDFLRSWLNSFAQRVGSELEWTFARASAKGIRDAFALMRDPAVIERRRKRSLALAAKSRAENKIAEENRLAHVRAAAIRREERGRFGAGEED